MNGGKIVVKEWNLLRVVACLSIVLLHCTTQIGKNVGYPDIENYHFYRMLLCYATPTFIVLSEIILANRYPSILPQNFWMKRIKYIFILVTLHSARRQGKSRGSRRRLLQRCAKLPGNIFSANA